MRIDLLIVLSLEFGVGIDLLIVVLMELSVLIDLSILLSVWECFY